MVRALVLLSQKPAFFATHDSCRLLLSASDTTKITYKII